MLEDWKQISLVSCSYSILFSEKAGLRFVTKTISYVSMISQFYMEEEEEEARRKSSGEEERRKNCSCLYGEESCVCERKGKMTFGRLLSTIHTKDYYIEENIFLCLICVFHGSSLKYSSNEKRMRRRNDDVFCETDGYIYMSGLLVLENSEKTLLPSLFMFVLLTPSFQEKLRKLTWKEDVWTTILCIVLARPVGHDEKMRKKGKPETMEEEGKAICQGKKRQNCYSMRVWLPRVMRKLHVSGENCSNMIILILSRKGRCLSVLLFSSISMFRKAGKCIL